MGRLVVRRLLDVGARVAVIDRDLSGLGDLAGDDRVVACENDVTDPDAVAAVAARIAGDLGPIDRLVCAAGIGMGGPLLDASTDDFRTTIDVNYFGIVHWIRAVVPAMVERGRGEVVLFASMAGWVPAPGMGPYCASKAAVVSLGETLARETEDDGVVVVVVCPPSVRTPMLDDFVDQGGLPDRALRVYKPLEPQVVVDAIEPALARGRLFCFPGRGTATLQRLRRWAPGAAWWAMKRLYR